MLDYETDACKKCLDSANVKHGRYHAYFLHYAHLHGYNSIDERHCQHTDTAYETGYRVVVLQDQSLLYWLNLVEFDIDIAIV